MENEEILQILSKLDKKLDKILALNTKIAKALHLLPVTEKEERDSMYMSLSKLREIMDWEAWCAACSPWSFKESYMTDRLNSNKLR